MSFEFDPTASSTRVDDESPQEVFAALVKQLDELFVKVAALESALNYYTAVAKKRTTRAQEATPDNDKEAEYQVLLEAKGNFIGHLTTAINDLQTIPGIPTGLISCYHKYYTLLKERLETSQQEIHRNIEEMKRLKEHLDSGTKQAETFKKLLGESENPEKEEESDEIGGLFTQAKNDLATVLSRIYPDRDDIKAEFASTMSKMTDAYVKNGQKENQYIELKPEVLKNPGIILLIKSCLIAADPANPLKYRLNMDE